MDIPLIFQMGFLLYLPALDLLHTMELYFGRQDDEL